MQVDYSSPIPPKEQRIEIASELASEYIKLIGFDINTETGQDFYEKTIKFYSLNNNLLKTLAGLVEQARN